MEKLVIYNQLNAVGTRLNQSESKSVFDQKVMKDLERLLGQLICAENDILRAQVTQEIQQIRDFLMMSIPGELSLTFNSSVFVMARDHTGNITTIAGEAAQA